MSKAKLIMNATQSLLELKNCIHCGTSHQLKGDFCCQGCDQVYHLLQEEGLQAQYQDLNPNRPPVQPVKESAEYQRDLQRWADTQKGQNQICFDLEGIHCSACVWLIEHAFEREKGAQQIDLNPTLGRALINVTDDFDLVHFAKRVGQFGYKIGPPSKKVEQESKDLLWRLGISASLTMNTMLLSVAFYMGLDPHSLVGVYFARTAWLLTTLNLLIGAWPILKKAWLLITARILHWDLPIALALLSAYSASVLQMYLGGSEAQWLDSLSAFMTLTLLGRFLLARTIAKNRQALLEETPLQSWEVSVVDQVNQSNQSNQSNLINLKKVFVEDLQVGQVLFLPASSLVPVDVQLISSEEIWCDMSWINGESAPQRFTQNQIIPAGAGTLGSQTLQALVLKKWQDSRLSMINQKSTDLMDEEPRVWARKLIVAYVPSVLSLAIIGALFWSRESWQVASNILSATLVVACPCALALTAPLIRHLGALRMRKLGIFLRKSKMIYLSHQLTQVVFDKTGTLSLGKLKVQVVQGESALKEQVSSFDQQVLKTLVSSSLHPKSTAILDRLADLSLMNFCPQEIVGEGMQIVLDGHQYRLGKFGFSGEMNDQIQADQIQADQIQALMHQTHFSKDGQILLSFEFEELARGDLNALIGAFKAQGLKVFLLSGDHQEKVTQFAKNLDFDDFIYEASPEQKAEWIKTHDPQKTLMVGDGMNDSFAFDVAALTASPIIDRPALLSKSDLCIAGHDLHALPTALAWAKQSDWVQRNAQLGALAYNIFAITLALSGLISPLVAAVLMPISSIVLSFWGIQQQKQLNPKFLGRSI
jgi:Cu2+-exporting ATPase